MRRSLLVLPLVLAFLLLGGCISQTYDQKVGYDGRSVISNTIDFSLVQGYYKQFGFASEAEFATNITTFSQDACAKMMGKDKTITCVSDGLTVTLSRNFTAKEGYYTFAVIEGVPYKTYRVVVNKIPADKFGKAAQGLKFMGYSEPGMVNPIDLKKKEDNAVSAQGLGSIPGFSFAYEVEMPGEVISAYAGDYQAGFSGTTATFDMVKVMGNSAPLVVESRELNVFLIAAGFGFFLLVLLAALFFTARKKHY